MESKPKKVQKKKANGQQVNVFAAGIAVIVAIAVIGTYVFTIMARNSGVDSDLVRGLSTLYRTPIAKINGDKVLYTSYLQDVETLDIFYASQQNGLPTPSDDEVTQQVLSRLIVNTLIEDIAPEFDVEVTDIDLETEKNNILAQFPDVETAQRELADRFGWDMDTYIERVVSPVILERKLAEAFEVGNTGEYEEFIDKEVRASHILFRVEEGDDQETVKTSAQEVLDRIKAGEDFGELAKEFGSDGTSDVGGDLGWFGPGVMVPAFEEAVFALEPGQLGEELVETQFGFHIVRLDEQRNRRSFESFMNAQIEAAKITLYGDIQNPFESFLKQLEDQEETQENTPGVRIEVEEVQ